MTIRQPPPQNVVQGVTTVATDVVTGLRSNPILLALIILNVIGIGMAAYIALEFMAAIERTATAQREMQLTVMRLCFPDETGKHFSDNLDGRRNKGDLK